MNIKTFLTIPFLALLLITPACGKKDNEPLATVDESLSTNVEEETEIQEEILQETASGPCNNILFPLTDGNEWVYEVKTVDENGSSSTVEYAWSVSEQQPNSVTLGTLFYDSGTVVSADIECVDGAVENFPLTVSNIVIGDMEGAITYTYVSGKYLPSQKELEAGNWENSWQTVVNSSGTITAAYEGETMTIILENSPITMNWQIQERDTSVTVPAGSFDNAVRISQELIYEINSLTVNISGTPMEISTKMTFDSDYWFVPNLGLVKTEIRSANLELFGSQFPVDMTGGSVLKSSNLLD